MNTELLDTQALRDTLAGKTGPAYWKGLTELAQSDAFRDGANHEFADGVDVWEEGPSRRGFLKLAGASMALAGVSGCARQPQEMIVPYIKQPEYFVPGKSMRFATAITRGGYAQGVVATSHDGRPTKIDGNPNHPANLGASDLYTQAEILNLYDPDRLTNITYLNTVRPWESFAEEVAKALDGARENRGKGVRLLTPRITSPTLIDQITTLQFDLPGLKWVSYETANHDNAYAGTELAFGQALNATYDLSNANIIISLDADFLQDGPANVRYTRQFADRRDVNDYNDGGEYAPNRLYCAEATITITGSNADHRLALTPSKIEAFARALGNALGVNAGDVAADAFGDDQAKVEAVIAAIKKDVSDNSGKVAVIAGDHQPAIVHAIAHGIMGASGSIGTTVNYIGAVEAKPGNQTQAFKTLADDMNNGDVDLLIVLGGNPVYDAPADIDFAAAMDKVAMCVFQGLSMNETADHSHWIIPALHELENWSDARAYDGTETVIQPLVYPLYAGRSEHEILSALLGAPEKKSQELVKNFWMGHLGMGEDRGRFEKTWRKILSEGVVAESAAQPVAVTAATDFSGIPSSAQADKLEVAFRLDPTIFDGRYGNNGWLQETPKPITKVAWENAVYIAPATAESLELFNDDVVEFTVNDTTVTGPLVVQPGHPLGSVTVHIGYGRTNAGRIAEGIGFDVNALRTTATLWATAGATIKRTGKNERIARTDEHYSMSYTQERGVEDVMQQAEARKLVRVGTASEYTANHGFAQEGVHVPGDDVTMFADLPWEGERWGMTIDLNRCIGCNACLVACNAENNIPVVGKDQFIRGREMHWIRIDRYYKGNDIDDVEVVHQPVPCMQCEDAPCELVCPVGATVHSREGLNDMVYNRCVGTRYCSNNCPYKVRRFNFLHFNKLQYGGGDYDSLALGNNPNVTVRTRGVMEKCTYCVQRISAARIESKKKGAKHVGTIVTACQESCPANAITFGSIAQADSKVTKAKESPRNYTLLADLNTRPRTSYLARVTNPNPDLAEG